MDYQQILSAIRNPPVTEQRQLVFKLTGQFIKRDYISIRREKLINKQTGCPHCNSLKYDCYGKDKGSIKYIRHGMVNIFMANEPLKGKRLVEITEYKTKKDWAKFMKRIADEMHPTAKKIRLVMDNFKTHDASAFYETFVPEEAKRLWDRFEFIFTPKHGSWLNMAEIEL